MWVRDIFQKNNILLKLQGARSFLDFYSTIYHTTCVTGEKKASHLLMKQESSQQQSLPCLLVERGEQFIATEGTEIHASVRW